MAEPTEEQKAFFEKHKLVLPSTRDSARSFMDFAEHGNTPENARLTFDERIAFLCGMQEVWIGHLVVHCMRKDTKAERGMYLNARTPYDMRHAIPQTGMLIQKGMPALRLSPLKLMINRGGHTVGIGLERLCLKSESEQEAKKEALL